MEGGRDEKENSMILVQDIKEAMINVSWSN